MATKPKSKPFRSSLDNQMDEEPVPGLSEISVADSRCPRYCPKFTCILKDNCNEKCRSLDVINATICDLCDDADKCIENRRKLLLDLEYMKHIDERNKDAIKSNTDELKAQHRHQELLFKDAHDRMINLKWYEMPQLNSLKKTKSDAVMRITVYREIFKMFNIDYQPDVVIDSTVNVSTTNPSKKLPISLSNLITLGAIIGLVLVYILFI